MVDKIMFIKLYFINFPEILIFKHSKKQFLNGPFSKFSVYHIPRILLKILPFAPIATWGMQGGVLGATWRKVGGPKIFLGLKKSKL